MASVPKVWYVRDNATSALVGTTLSTITALGTIGWSAVTGWSASASITVGSIVRQSANPITCVGGQSTTTLTVSSISQGTIFTGCVLTPATTSEVVNSLGTGTGGAGTYTMNASLTVTAGTTYNGGLKTNAERCFIAAMASTGTTGATEPAWSAGGNNLANKFTDNTVTWYECTGQPVVNGDATNQPNWTAVKNTSPGGGAIIVDNARTHVFVQTSTAGTTGNGSEPSWNTTTPGQTTTDGTVTWTYVGLASSYPAWGAPAAHLAIPFVYAGSNIDTFYLADDHSETSANSVSLAPSSVSSTPVPILSIDHTTSLPPTGASALKAGATIACTGSVSMALGNTAGSGYWYGITFSTGLSWQIIGNTWNSLENCSIILNNATTSAEIIVGSANVSNHTEWLNTTVTFGAVAQSFKMLGNYFRWRNTPNAVQGSVPTNLFVETGTGSLGITVIEGVDLSALGSGKTLINAGSVDYCLFQLIDCKLGASVTLCDNPNTAVAAPRDFMRCSNSSGTAVQRRFTYTGTLQEETTIVRTGGASDGITPISWKIVTTANSRWVMPFESFPISIWNTRTGSSVTVTVYGIWGGGAVPNTDDIWIDVRYLGSSGSPLASHATSTKSNNLATGTALASDTSTWGGSTTKFKMAVTVTPQLVGYLRVYVRAAKVSSTFYIDPLPVLS